MSCFSLAWLENILIWLVIICAVIAILKIIVPWALSKMQATGIIAEGINLVANVLRIVIWAIIIIFVIIICFDLISCLISAGGLHFPRMTR